MGLFSRRKKVPKAPAPRSLEQPLSFSKIKLPEKIIKPEDIKEAAGLQEPVMDIPEIAAPMAKPKLGEPLFVKVNVYRKILEEIDALKSRLADMQNTNKDIAKSDYNSEENFGKLKRQIKVVHDKLLDADKTLFKGD